jgi:uncharacterized protein YvpB
MKPMRYSLRAGYVRGFVASLLGIFLLSLGVPSAAQAASGTVRIVGFPALHQAYSLSCEYAAASAVTRYWGTVVTEQIFLRAVPASPNPHLGFRGDITADFGGIIDYGVYAEPLVPVLERAGYQAAVYYNDQARLLANLRSGNPVVVWLTAGTQARTVLTRTYAGETFTLVPGEHALVVYGYTASAVNVMDVATGGYTQIAWASFLRRWGYFDNMMLVITPADR